MTDTLIADGDGLYHPGDFNDRLVLGLKGTMSEAELHLIRHRLTAGLRHKAAKGELRQGVPVGFVYDDDDRVIMDPNEAVIEAIATVFRRFDELGSARQVMLSLRGDGVLIPRRPAGAKRIVWAPATYPAIHDFLTNPAYAGAFVFGRTRTDKRLDASRPAGVTHQAAAPRPVGGVDPRSPPLGSSRGNGSSRSKISCGPTGGRHAVTAVAPCGKAPPSCRVWSVAAGAVG